MFHDRLGYQQSSHAALLPQEEEHGSQLETELLYSREGWRKVNKFEVEKGINIVRKGKWGDLRGCGAEKAG
jgi:hypothetical protein